MDAGRRRYGLIGLMAVVALAAAWTTRLGRRRRSARVAAAEARMEPRPVVY